MSQFSNWPTTKKEKKNKPSEQERYQNDQNESWNQLDDMEQQNLDNFQRESESASEEQKKQKKPKANPKKRKANEIQEYQTALIKLRKSASKEFCNPFRKQNLNMELMPHRKMLFDAWQKQKDYVDTLRKLGIKTRMRVRNKSLVKSLLQWMLNYVESGELPEQLKKNHFALLQKDDSQFDIFQKGEL